MVAHACNPRRLKQKNQYGFRTILVYTANSKVNSRRQSEILSQIIHRASVVLSKHGCTYSHSYCPRLLCTTVVEPSHCNRDHMTWEVSTLTLWPLAQQESLLSLLYAAVFVVHWETPLPMTPAPVDRDHIVPIFLCPSSPIDVSLPETLPKAKHRDKLQPGGLG